MEMSEMVERVARAISQAMEEGFPRFTKQNWEDLTPLAQASMRHRARAAIAAMREPTGTMLDIGEHQYLKAECGLLSTNVSPMHNAWDVMIDEALTGRRAAWLASPTPADQATVPSPEEARDSP